MTKKKPERPTKFKLGTFNWTIKYLDIESDVHGETLTDSKEIHIITRNKTEQLMKDTLLHECLHVVLEDIVDTAVKIDDKPEVIEEHIVRLLTPRLHEMFTNNKELNAYIFGK
jgi:hypothetical protein